MKRFKKLFDEIIRIDSVLGSKSEAKEVELCLNISLKTGRTFWFLFLINLCRFTNCGARTRIKTQI